MRLPPVLLYSNRMRPHCTHPTSHLVMNGFSSGCAGSELTIGDQFLAGAGAGVAISLLACPMELVKCRLQAGAAVRRALESSSKTCHLLKRLKVKLCTSLQVFLHAWAN